jgi:hypothetical protein
MRKMILTIRPAPKTTKAILKMGTRDTAKIPLSMATVSGENLSITSGRIISLGLEMA